MAEADAFADAYLAAAEDADAESICRYLLERFVGGVLGIDPTDDREAFESLDALDIGFEAAIDIGTLGSGFEAVLAKRGTQGETGSYYTLEYVVDYIVEETVAEQLDTHEDIDDIHVLDPACGAGDFLLGALEELADARQERNGTPEFVAYQRTAAHNCYGVDIQPAAVEIAKLRIRLAVLAKLPRPDLQALGVGQ